MKGKQNFPSALGLLCHFRFPQRQDTKGRGGITARGVIATLSPTAPEDSSCFIVSLWDDLKKGGGR